MICMNYRDAGVSGSLNNACVAMHIRRTDKFKGRGVRI